MHPQRVSKVAWQPPVQTPQGLKPSFRLQPCAARLKSCPDTSCNFDWAFPEIAKSCPDAKRFLNSGLKKLVLAATMVFVLAPARAARAADDLDKVLRKLDVAAAKFHTTSADFEFDTVTTEPIYNDDVQKGTTYYKREGGGFQWSAHINEVNGKPVPKVVVLSGGVLKLYEKLVDQVTTITKLSQYQSWFMLGFGASGKELEEKWVIKYLGTEKIDGVTTEKLELVAKDPTIRWNIPKVTFWMDTERGVSLQQVFDQGEGQSRTCHYTNIKMNQPLPGDAFTFKADRQTRFVSQ